MKVLGYHLQGSQAAIVVTDIEIEFLVRAENDCYVLEPTSSLLKVVYTS